MSQFKQWWDSLLSDNDAPYIVDKEIFKWGKLIAICSWNASRQSILARLEEKDVVEQVMQTLDTVWTENRTVTMRYTANQVLATIRKVLGDAND